jgi:plastocyanin
MRFATIVSTFLGLAACVCADNITVKVGENGGLTYSPESVTAKEGDIISFQFLAKNHSVTQSSFNDPCTRLTTPTLGIDSDYQPVPANATMVPQYSFTVVNASSPLWFYCKQGAHCKAGMVFAVNPTAEKTFDAFKAKATGANSTSGSSSVVSPSSGSNPTPSATNNPSGDGALGLGPSTLVGVITLVAIFAGSVL